jgi:hypothetical protein
MKRAPSHVVTLRSSCCLLIEREHAHRLIALNRPFNREVNDAPRGHPLVQISEAPIVTRIVTTPMAVLAMLN